MSEPAPGAPSRIVGVGASAGGLEALEALFGDMPADGGLAFVVVLHLSPHFKSHMEELLARRTRLPVHTVTEGAVVRADNVYVIPPGKEMVLTGGRLQLTDRSTERVLTHPVDQFFRSLANEAGARAVGVVLSGTGSDGSRGVREIHEAGGLVLCQDAASARFDGMPINAQATGAVDVVCPPHEMAAALRRHAGLASVPGPSGAPPSADADARQTAGSDPALGEVFRLLRRFGGVDFAHYKGATVGRRVERRMAVHGLDDIAAYTEHVNEHPEEIEALYKDLLIGVTRFFRDAEAFARLEAEVLPRLVAALGERRELRVWVAGCASGEEAYSLAMLFDERLRRDGSDAELKLFATDIHKGSLEFASRGHYPHEAMKEVSAERRERYFVERDDGFQVRPWLRKSIVFSSHNVFNDAPFTQLDMVSCRNLLIYLQAPAQRKALALFHFALRTGGALLLGTSETPGEIDDEFETVDARWRLYRKRRDIRLPFDSRVPMATGRFALPRAALPAGRGRTPGPGSDLLATYDRLLELHMPPSFLVTEDHALVHTFGGAERYLRARGGRPSSGLLDAIEDRLRTPLAAALQQAARDNAEVRYTGLRLGRGDDEELLELHVLPLTDPRANAASLLVRLLPDARAAAASSFAARVASANEPGGTDPEGANGSDDPDAANADGETSDAALDLGRLHAERIESLETDLHRTRENLQATIEELETSNEELQAANEEMLASNEELQSTNEELQSVNEELFTVNSEHQSKIEQLVRAHDDMDNLLDVTRVGVVFVDAELRVRRYTPEIARLLDMREQDIGRSIESFAHHFGDVDLAAETAAVTGGGETRELETIGRDGRSYLMRIAPYRRSDTVSGAAVALVDVEALAAAQRDTRRFRMMSDQAVVGQALIDREGRFLYVNEAHARLHGRSVEQMQRLGVQDVNRAYPVERLRELFDELRETPLPAFESSLQRPDGSDVAIEVMANTVNIDGTVLMYSTVTDITARVQARRSLAEATEAADAANPRQERVPGQHEPRDPHAADRDHGDDGPDAHDARRIRAPVPRRRHQAQRPPPARHRQRHPGPVQDRGRSAAHGARARVARGAGVGPALDVLGARRREGAGAERRVRHARAGHHRLGPAAAAPDPAEPSSATPSSSPRTARSRCVWRCATPRCTSASRTPASASTSPRPRRCSGPSCRARSPCWTATAAPGSG